MSLEVGQATWVNEFNQPSKAGVIAVFYDKEEPDPKRSEAEGRACFRLKTFLRKEIPGDNLTVVERPARDTDREEFPKEWERYRTKQNHVVDGTPIEQWPVLNRAQVAEFKALNIHSVEQFYAMPEVHGAKIMGFNTLKAKAREFLTWRKESEKVEAIKADAAMKDERIASLESQLAELRAMIDAKPRRGRPRKINGVADGDHIT